MCHDPCHKFSMALRTDARCWPDLRIGSLAHLPPAGYGEIAFIRFLVAMTTLAASLVLLWICQDGELPASRYLFAVCCLALGEPQEGEQALVALSNSEADVTALDRESPGAVHELLGDLCVYVVW